MRLKLTVAGRHFHRDRLAELTGVRVEEGKATILLNDLQAWAYAKGQPIESAASIWREGVYYPAMARAHLALEAVDPVQALCDLLEIRWLLSERAGRDVGERVALSALQERRAPDDSAAQLVAAEDAPGGLDGA